MNLLALAEDYKTIFDCISEDQMDSECWLRNIMDTVNGKFEDKASNIAAFVLKLEEDLREMKVQEKEIKQRMEIKIDNLENRINSIKEYISIGMDQVNKKYIKSPIIDILIRNNSPRTIIEDENKIPEEFKISKEVISIDKTSIKKKIQNGEIVPGAFLEDSKSLIIKSNI